MRDFLGRSMRKLRELFIEWLKILDVKIKLDTIQTALYGLKIK